MSVGSFAACKAPVRFRCDLIHPPSKANNASTCCGAPAQSQKPKSFANRSCVSTSERASGDVQKLQELARTSTSTSFGDIRWDTDNGSPNLCSQPEPLFRGETVRKGINLTRQFHRLLPNHQIVMWSRHPLPPIA